MKYIISESQLEKYILDYFEKLFPIDRVNWHHPYYYDDDTGEEGDQLTLAEFYLDDFNEGENMIFRWYDCDYFTEESQARQFCPIVAIESEYEYKLDSFFGDKWRPIFKLWFEENFKFDVKAVDYI